MENKKYIIYAHIRKTPSENGIYKRYIGITCQKPENRWGKNGSKYSKKNKNGKDNYFANAIKKYGWDNFEHRIIAHDLAKEQAEYLEEKLIKYYKLNDKKYGYNLKSGGKTNQYNEEVRKKISLSHKGLLTGKKNPMYGKKGELHPNFNKINYKMLGKNNPSAKQIICLETKEIFDTIKECSDKMDIDYVSICQCCNEKYNTAGGKHFMHYNKYLNSSQDEIKNKLKSVREFGKHKSKVICLTTGEIFDSIKEASEKYNLSSSNISAVCNKKHHTAGKKEWTYIDK